MLLNLSPHSVIAVGVLLPTLASAAVGLRFLTWHRLRVALIEDDWTLLISAVLAWDSESQTLLVRRQGRWVLIQSGQVPMRLIRIHFSEVLKMRLPSRYGIYSLSTSLTLGYALTLLRLSLDIA
jgi:hypothetical protein